MGVSRGLGLVIKRALAAEGCAVAIVARRGELIEREARAIVAQPEGRALALVADATRPRLLLSDVALAGLIRSATTIQASIACGGMSPFRPIDARAAIAHGCFHLNADRK